MQITTLSRRLTPISLATGLLLSSNFMYSDFDRCSSFDTQLKSEAIENYISKLGYKVDSEFIIRQNFNSLYEEWQKKVFLLSSVEQITGQREFREIINMGMAVVPIIIETIDKEPSFLVWALNCIFGKKISNKSNLTIQDACKLWVKALRN